MLHTLLCYDDEATVAARSPGADAAVMDRLDTVHRKWTAHIRTRVRLMPTTAAATLRTWDGPVLEGPFAEAREQLLGFCLVEADALNTAVAIARDLAEAAPRGAWEIRPILACRPAASTRDG
jgi:hypothetical protein